MASRITNTTETQLRRARSELESGLSLGQEIRAENLIERYSELATDNEAILELIYSEFVTKESLGQPQTRTDIYERFPLLREDLEQLFVLHDELRDAGVNLPSIAPDGTRRQGTSVKRGERIGNYEIAEEIGRGGMGVVYRARHRTLDRPVALKVILAGVHAGPKDHERFQREVDAAARLDHPNIVRVYEVGEHDGRPFCALEYVAGGSLADLLKGQPWPSAKAAALVAILARAAQHAHERGVVHRDLKPANILISSSTTKTEPAPPSSLELGESLFPKIADFGLAKSINDLHPGLTRTGDVLGTPAYMAPEQTDGSGLQTSAATDVWALGVIFYELLTGRLPFIGESTADTLHLIRRNEPVSPRAISPKLSRDLETICLKCLEKSAGSRYSSAAALADDIERWQRLETILARPVSTPTRALKWVRRNPSTAAWLSIVFVVGLSGLVGVLSYGVRAEFRRREAEAARESARLATEEARSALYYSQVGRAFFEWQSSNQDGAKSLIESASSYEKAGWESAYVKHLVNDDILTLHGHGNPVCSVAYSPDGKRIATGTGRWGSHLEGVLRIWDAKSGELLCKIDTKRGLIHSLSFSPDGRVVATASMRFGKNHAGGVVFWDTATGAELGTIGSDDESVPSVSFSPDGKLVATGSTSGRVRLWDFNTRTEIATLGSHANGAVHSLAFRPDGKRIVTGGYDGSVILWDVARRAEVGRISQNGDTRVVAYSPDGKHIAAGGYDTIVRVWNENNLELVSSHDRHDNPILGLYFTPDGFYTASSDSSGLTHIRSALVQYGDFRTILGHTGGILGLAISPDGMHIATAGADGTVRVNEAWREQGFQRISLTGSPLGRIAYSPDGLHLAVAGPPGFTSRSIENSKLIHVSNTKTLSSSERVFRHSQTVTGLSYSRDGSRLASGSVDKTVMIWDTRDGTHVKTLKGHTGAVNDVAFDPLRDRLISVGDDATLRIWFLDENREPVVIPTEGAPQVRAMFSSDGSIIASASGDGRVRIWDAHTLVCKTVKSIFDAPVSSLAISADGNVIAVASEERGVVMWNIKSGELIKLDEAHSRGVCCLAISPDGHRLATSSRDSSVRLWNIETGVEAFSFRPRHGDATCVAFRPDGHQLAAGLREGSQVYFWDDGLAIENREVRAQTEAKSYHLKMRALALDSNNWFAARYHLNYLVLSEKPNNSYLSQRGRALAELGEYQLASDDYSKLIQSLPRDYFPAFYFRALLSLRRGQFDEYRTQCRELWTKFSNSQNVDFRYDLIFLNVLSTDFLVPPADLIALAEKNLAAQPKGIHHKTAMSLVCLRTGRLEDAIKLSGEAIVLEGKEPTFVNWVILAMANHKLGRHQEAQDWLAKATAYQTIPPPKSSTPLPWTFAIQHELLYTQAKQMIIK